MIEVKCLNLCDLTGRSNLDIQLKDYERVYVGSYFCDNFFLNIQDNDLEKIISSKRSNNEAKLNFTLVVPMFSQEHLHKGKQKIKELFDKYCDVIDEVTVNDLGMIAHIGENYNIAINIGRLLVKDYRDLRYEEYTKGTIFPKIFTKYFDSLRKKYRIRTVELDPTNKTIDLSEMPENMQAAIHDPLCYITTGRICEFESISKPVELKFRPDNTCTRECTHYNLLYYPKDDVVWLRLGRAVYFYNEAVTIKGINKIRIIHFPVMELKLYENRKDKTNYEHFSSGEQ